MRARRRCLFAEAADFEGQAFREGTLAEHKVRVGAGGGTETELAIFVQRVGAKGSHVLMGGDNQGFGFASVEGHEPTLGPVLDGGEVS